LQIVLYDIPGVIKKEMHKLDSMMMKNVRSAIGSADCVLVVVDACKMPEKVLQYLLRNEWIFYFPLIPYILQVCAIRLMICWKKVWEIKILNYLFC
jgi:GTPase Era involved in 16S rRNA processing